MNHQLSQLLPPLLIPCYQPGEKLAELVGELIKDPYPLILIINDGSTEKLEIFEQLLTLDGVEIIDHQVNQGKGEALKTGLKYFQSQDYPLGMVTVDADGQHLPQDILKVAKCFCQFPDKLILGSRAFDKNVPLRSSFGNTMTKFVFNLVVGRQISDTQTGLRAIPKDFFADLLNLKTGRYEFELDMLICAKQMKMDFEEVPITTVYEGKNESSHFNPIIDSLRIYFVFSSLLTAGIDFLVFALFHHFTGSIKTSMVASRLVAASFNFFYVRFIVFKHHGSLLKAALKFSLLVLVMSSLSYGLIKLAVDKFSMNVISAKLLVETGLFFTNFTIQRLYIFNRRRWKKRKALKNNQ